MSLSFQERDLAKLGIDASVESAGPGWLEITLSEDDLDHLLDCYMSPDALSERLYEAEASAQEIATEQGEETGYENALADLKDEDGPIWDTVKPMLERAFEDGHQTACEEIEELAT